MARYLVSSTLMRLGSDRSSVLMVAAGIALFNIACGGDGVVDSADRAITIAADAGAPVTADAGSPDARAPDAGSSDAGSPCMLTSYMTQYGGTPFNSDNSPNSDGCIVSTLGSTPPVGCQSDANCVGQSAPSGPSCVAGICVTILGDADWVCPTTPADQVALCSGVGGAPQPPGYPLPSAADVETWNQGAYLGSSPWSGTDISLSPPAGGDPSAGGYDDDERDVFSFSASAGAGLPGDFIDYPNAADDLYPASADSSYDGVGMPSGFDEEPTTNLYVGYNAGYPAPPADQLGGSYAGPPNGIPSDATWIGYGTGATTAFSGFALGATPMQNNQFAAFNEFRNRNATGPFSSSGQNPGPYNLVQLGSSMMSTHFQRQNGRMCSADSTTADRRNLRGDDATRSPGWLMNWRKLEALGRTGFSVAEVIGANAKTLDACNNAWNNNQTPMQAALNWLTLVGSNMGLVVTDGGIINSQQSSTGGGWSDTVVGIVGCQALNAAQGKINIALAALSAAVIGNNANTVPPSVKIVRQTPLGANGKLVPWSQVIDLPTAGGPVAGTTGRCWYALNSGNGKMSTALAAALVALGSVEISVPPIAAPPNVAASVAQIANLYQTAVAGGIRQVWLQYPYMDQAPVTLTGRELKILPYTRGIPNFVVNAVGRATAMTFNAVDNALQPRVAQVTDDLNNVMWTGLGCPGNYVKGTRATAIGGLSTPGTPNGHPATLCGLRTAVTTNNHAGWGPASHQATIIGGMPHESAIGAAQLAASLSAALPLLP